MKPDKTSWEIIGIDTGGTFSDTVAIGNNEIRVFKVPSTPTDPTNAVIKSITRTGFSKELIHGTTVATNAVLERKGAKVALITTKNFGDIIEIGRQNRDDIYALYPQRPRPLVPRQLRFEVDERIVNDGSVEKVLDKEELIELTNNLEDFDIESIAICTLFSFLNPVHEKMIAKYLEDKYPISLSSEVFPEYREYERTSTTVIDAYVKPIISRYITSLENYLTDQKLTDIFAVMKSDKGLAKGQSLAKIPVDTLFSGLAGGIKAAEYTSELTNHKDLISIDIGGTSSDASAIVDGRGSLQQGLKISGLPVAAPAVDVETIGAGGGSLVTYVSGLIKVGPESAGAEPGPVAYNLGGTIPTVTDADLCYGILPEDLAGGELVMDKSLAIQAISEFSEKIDLEFEATVKGIRRIFHENIASALRAVSTERGHDPRQFALLGFGGAGPVHAAELAELMKIPTVIIPPFPGIWSAIGLLGGDYSYNLSRGLITPWEQISLEAIESIFEELIQSAHDLADSDNLASSNRIITKSVSIRFQGQSYDLVVPFSDKQTTKSEFIQHHRERYGFAAEDEPVELVALRINLTLPHLNPLLPTIDSENEVKPIKYRKIIGIDHEVAVYEKEEFGRNTELMGPIIVEQSDTTIWVPEKWRLNLDKYGFVYLSNINSD